MIVEPVVQATASGTAVRLQDTAQKGDWLTPEEAAWGIGAMIVSNSGRLCSLSHSRSPMRHRAKAPGATCDAAGSGAEMD